ncbi:MAG TPA: phosphoglycolate phosphatase [Gammaproteobacteria bacterium]|nr:phosphoglycolate phosphatase [Gammaproteobacteria bacterium]
MASIKLVAFDLDGTLVDSAADIASAVCRMTEELALPPPDIGTVRTWVGDGVRLLLKRALGVERDSEPPAELYQRAFEAFRRAYHEHLVSESCLYAGALDTLRFLHARDFALACITNKAAEFTTPLLDALGIGPYFGLVLSGDSLTQRKPHPLPLLHAAQHLGVSPARACMVGDSRNDLLAARAANFMAIGVRYGYGGDLTGLEADAVLDSLTQLPPLLMQTTLRHAPELTG